MLAIVGAAMGILMALALSRVLSSLVFGIASYDPATMAVSGLVLLGVAVAAAWLPARRVARIDPMVALRYE
jgi:ABC-type antimicrobial peptide transport system permease subunit